MEPQIKQQLKGQRELSQAELDLMNEIKAFGPQLRELVAKVHKHIASQYTECGCCAIARGQTLIIGQFDTSRPCDDKGEHLRLQEAAPGKWATEGAMLLQEGMMFLSRAVAQPTTFF